MSAPPFGIPVSTSLAIAIVLAAVSLGFLAARAVRRAAHEGVRHGAANLFRLLAGRLAGHVAADSLLDAARETHSSAFWGAIEAITHTLRRRERLELARSLARSRHLVAERRALRLFEAPERSELAARRLGLLPTARSRRALRHALARGPEAVRLAAARSLARHRDLAALRWLLANPSLLASRPIPALSGLLRAFGPGARATLIRALEQGVAEPRLECAILDALGLSRCRSARERIERCLRGGKLEVRIAAARALGRLGMGESIPSLLPALADEAWAVRAQSAHALGRLRATPAVEALAARVADRSWWVRHHAAYALVALGSEGRDALCDVVVNSPDGFAREMAREALDRGAARRSA